MSIEVSEGEDADVKKIEGYYVLYIFVPKADCENW